MKSRMTTYLLIAVVVVVWGVILWKVFLKMDNKPSMAIPQPKAVVVDHANDTLLLNYRDPFLGTMVQKAMPNPEPKGVTRTASKHIPEPPSVDHHLRYLGQISRGGTPFVILEINGTLCTMSRGETADSYQLETVWMDSVRLMFKNEAYIIRMEQ